MRPDGSKVFPDDGRSITDFHAAESDIVVAANPAGGSFVAVSVGTADGAQLFVQSFDAAGNPRWATGGVFAATTVYGDRQIQPQLVAAPQGGVYLCFQDFHGVGGGGSDIVCQRFSAAGQRLWTDPGILAGGLAGEIRELPKLVRDDRNGLLVFWRNTRMGLLVPNEHVLIEGQHFAPDGTRGWGARGRIVRATNLPAGTGSLSISLSAVSDGHGGAVVSFDDGPSPTNLDAFAQRITGDGRLLWRNGVPLATGSAYQGNDSLTAAPDGGAFVTVWQPAPPFDQLLLYRLGPDGKVLWKQRVTAGDPNYSLSDYGAYASFVNGRLRLAWAHFGQAGSIDVYLAVYDLAGHRLNGADGTLLTSAPSSQFLRGFVFDPARRQGLAVWNDERKGDFNDFDTIGALYRE
jgi:hypothetical protein